MYIKKISKKKIQKKIKIFPQKVDFFKFIFPLVFRELIREIFLFFIKNIF